jgi:hypothetical protein
MKKLLNKHKELTEKMQAKLGLSNYAMLWVSFGKGVALALLLKSCL